MVADDLSAAVMRFLLRRAIAPFLSILGKWIYSGILEVSPPPPFPSGSFFIGMEQDPAGEFCIRHSDVGSVIRQRASEEHWNFAYRLAVFPPFMKSAEKMVSVKSFLSFFDRDSSC